MSEIWLKEINKEARAILKEWCGNRFLWKDLPPVYLANTEEGRRAYYRETGEPAVVMAGLGFEYGNNETHNGKHFIFLNSILVSNYLVGDTLSTIIHEILHILDPNSSEQAICDMETEICRQYKIDRENVLDEWLAWSKIEEVK